MILGTLLLACAVHAQDAVQLKGKRVEIEPRFPTQRTDLVVLRPLGESIRIGELEYPVVKETSGWRIAMKPGGRPKKLVRRPTTLKLGGHRVFVRDGACARLDALEFKLEQTVFRLLDLDMDAEYDDGYQLPPHHFVLPMDGPLILGRHRLAVESIRKRRLRGTVTPLAGSRQQLDGLVLINKLRASIGLPATEIDDKLSDACSKHARYLRLNKWNGLGNPHFEVKGRRGFTPEGHRAGMLSVILWGSHTSAVPGHWITYYHRFSFLHPRLRGVGISDGTPSVSIIDGKSGSEWGDAPPRGWKDPVLVPADGSIRVPKGFHRAGEMPSPVEHAGSRGFPMTVLFLSPKPGISEFRGSLERLNKHGKSEIVETLLPRQNGSSGRFGLIPARPLRGGRYRTTYTYRRNGERETVSATFETE
ncbi:MAG: CAP domain-containing protein [Planctomycetota bacterium]